jgi:hypothetical protein
VLEDNVNVVVDRDIAAFSEERKWCLPQPPGSHAAVTWNKLACGTLLVTQMQKRTEELLLPPSPEVAASIFTGCAGRLRLRSSIRSTRLWLGTCHVELRFIHFKHRINRRTQHTKMIANTLSAFSSAGKTNTFVDAVGPSLSWRG